MLAWRMSQTRYNNCGAALTCRSGIQRFGISVQIHPCCSWALSQTCGTTLEQSVSCELRDKRPLHSKRYGESEFQLTVRQMLWHNPWERSTSSVPQSKIMESMKSFKLRLNWRLGINTGRKSGRETAQSYNSAFYSAISDISMAREESGGNHL